MLNAVYPNRLKVDGIQSWHNCPVIEPVSFRPAECHSNKAFQPPGQAFTLTDNFWPVHKLHTHLSCKDIDKSLTPPPTTHVFRHAAASELLEEGAPLTVVQQQLRHGDAKTTLQKYGHVVGDSQRRAVNRLAEKIEGSAVELESGAELESSVG